MRVAEGRSGRGCGVGRVRGGGGGLARCESKLGRVFAGGIVTHGGGGHHVIKTRTRIGGGYHAQMFRQVLKGSQRIVKVAWSIGRPNFDGRGLVDS